MIGRTAARVILLALAAMALAWFAYDLRAVSLAAQGRSAARLAQRTPQVDRALSLFAQAARGNADPTPRIDEARFLISLGRSRQAADVLNAVARTNPGNVLAWSLLASATAADDRRREAEANQQLFLLFGHPVVYYAAQGALFSPTGLDTVVPAQVQGNVDRVQIIGNVARLTGWSASVSKKAGQGFSVVPSEDVLILADGRFVVGGTPTIARPDIGRHFHVPVPGVGFSIDVPVAQLETASTKDLVQIFGSSPGVASLLPVNCSPRPQPFGCSR